MNIVFMKVPESDQESSSQREDYYKFIYEELEMEENIVTRCYTVTGQERQDKNIADR